MHDDELWEISPVDQSEELCQDVRDLAQVVADHDEVSPLNEQGLRILVGQVPGLHLVAVDEGNLIGYAQLDTQDQSVQLFVDPGRRHEGIGRALAETIQTMHEGDEPLGWWSFGTLPQARELADALGLQAERTILRMTLDPAATSLAQVGDSPEGLTITTFTEDDIDDLVETNRLAFAHHPEQASMSRQDVLDKMAEDWFDPAGLFLARDDQGRLLGFHWTKVLTKDDPDKGQVVLGEVYVIGVHPFEHGRGLGSHLLALGLDHMVRQRQVGLVELYVEGANDRVVQMYERAGFREARRDTSWL
ncbi:mycothiol synthase [Aestuariimicrobium sp. p3-SID1156]|uniref:mycothiol synthase n=1 Tax=Aestuariimicrobium sp. p3-SID1156 TaxID=2916038 RepID=UPI00223AEFE2|nr:mycothiol synthase [Aestuariimicrobium sp. p3-SID1156]MCT1458683.1 mycothiol synthase [Aestuariimicrobium sp. p3-SID1156]